MKTKAIFAVKGEVLFNQPVAEGRYLMRLKTSEIASVAQPGQFIQLKLSDIDPLLPRPFAISYVNSGWIEVLYELRGKGTHLLAQTAQGEKIRLLGPLGKNFRLPAKKEPLLLIAGGIGLAPLRFLAQQAFKTGYPVKLLYGEKEKSKLLPLETLLPEGCSFVLVVENGETERTGKVTDFLPEVFESFQPVCVFSCGPKEMLKQIYLYLVDKKIQSYQCSLEERMACGYGACQGCVVLTTAGYKRVCKDGPVFEGKEIDWKQN